MKRHSIISKKVNGGAEFDFVLDYSLILTDRREFDLFEEKDIYSVLILQLENGIATDYDFIYDIARDEKKAVEILNLFVYNKVMPQNAREVFADYV